MTEKRITILDIPFDKVTLHGILERTLNILKHPSSKPFFIATPNPEMLLAARKNSFFKNVLQQTDLNIPDGFGVLLASKIIRSTLPERVTGTDLMQEICIHAPAGTKFFLLGAAPGVAEKVKTELEKLNPAIEIVGALSSSPAHIHEKDLHSSINYHKPDILFVAFGAPKQELWLSRNLPYFHSVKIAMGVGGAFDFLAGVRKRAPGWMRKCGLEWLYRLIQQPGRVHRIFNATIKFPVLFLLSLLWKKENEP